MVRNKHARACKESAIDTDREDGIVKRESFAPKLGTACARCLKGIGMFELAELAVSADGFPLAPRRLADVRQRASHACCGASEPKHGRGMLLEKGDRRRYAMSRRGNLVSGGRY